MRLRPAVHLTAVLAAVTLALAAGAEDAASTRRLRLPDISADGSRVVWVEDVLDGAGRPTSSEIRMAAGDGSANHVVATARFVSGVSVSPDGSAVVFARADEMPGIWAVGADGSGLRRLVGTQPSDRAPRFGRDGRSVLFVRPSPQSLLESSGMLVELPGGRVRELLRSQYRVTELGPLGEGEDGWWALCSPLGPNGAPVPGLTLDSAVARIPLNGSAPTPLFIPPTGKRLAGFQAGDGWRVAQIYNAVPEPHWVEGGQIKPLAEKRVVRLTPDGKRGVGTPLDRELNGYVEVYDLPAQGRRAISGRPYLDAQPRTAKVDAVAFGKALQALVAAAPGSFEKLRTGEPRVFARRKLFGSTVDVPGARPVEISVPDVPNSFNQPYAAAEVYRGEVSEASKAAYRDTIALVKSILPTWAAKENRFDVVGTEVVRTVFADPDGLVEVSVQQSADPVLGPRATLRVERVHKP